MEPMEIIRAAEAHDGIAPLSEQFLLGVEDSSLGHEHFLIDGALAALAPDGSVELVVHPSHRRQGKGSELVSRVGKAGKFWAHGNLEGARALAAELGMEPTRELLVMSVDAADLEFAVELPEGAMDYVEACERFGREKVEEQWLAVNNDAFSWHPEQGGWDMPRLKRAMDTDWFDPHGVWFLYRGDGGDADMAGFHWTKRHPGSVGEVYVVGLSSSYRGEGMGVPLMEVGLKYLVEGGSSQVILYVESDNEPAVRRYRETGFTIAESHVVYEFPAN